jgi:HSP20 family molecular chaperone IbpA
VKNLLVGKVSGSEIPLPDGVEVAKVEATCAKGVLTVQFPKAATETPRGRRLQSTRAEHDR